MQEFIRWIEIDLDAIRHNFQEIRKLVPLGVKIQAVVKSDAYGHGAVEVARVLEKAGADMFAVTTVEEGIELAEKGISLPVLVFAPVLPFQMDTVLRYGLIPTLDNLSSLEALAGSAKAQGRKGVFHLKVETGFGRAGVLPEEITPFLRRCRELPEIEMGGVYSHLATSMMANKSYARKQYAIFRRVLNEIRGAGQETVLAHIANSAAVLDLPEMYLDMVRVGTLLYGQYPSDQVSRKLRLEDPWQVKALIISVKKLKPGEAVGYGRDYLVRRPMEVGIVPIGYADGFGVLPHTRPVRPYHLIKSAARGITNMAGLAPANFVIWREQRLPVVGRIGMQLSVVDITGCQARVGDEVKIILRRTTAGARLPRIFFQNEEIRAVRSICPSWSKESTDEEREF